jgi:endogenous inhibitor of DNA gyrase (YacG/DUF329 family)
MESVRCPICDGAMPANWSEYPDYPFCSKRCRTIDLGRWLGEGYRVSGGPADDRDRSTAGDGSEARDAR